MKISRKNIIILVGVVTMLIFGLWLYNMNSKVESKTVKRPNTKYNYDHPFDKSHTGLLNDTTDEQSTVTTQLNYYEIKSTIDSVIKTALPHASHDTLLVIEDLTIPLTAYDNNEKIGYLLIDPNKYGEGIKNAKSNKIKSQKGYESEFLSHVDYGIEYYLDDPEIFLDLTFGPTIENQKEKQDENKKIIADWEVASKKLQEGKVKFEDVQEEFFKFRSVNYTGTSSRFREWALSPYLQELDNEIIVNTGNEVRKQLSAFSETSDQIEYLEVMLSEMFKALEVERLSSIYQKSMVDEWKLAAAQIVEEPARYYGIVKRINKTAISSSNAQLQKAFEEQLFQISIQKRHKKWLAHTNALIELINHHDNFDLQRNLKYQTLLIDILSDNKYSKWKKQYPNIKRIEDEISISKYEIENLDYLAHEYGIFIAPISTADTRMTYDMGEAAYQNELTELRKELRQESNRKKKDDLQQALRDKTEERSNNFAAIRDKAKSKTVTTLQQNVETYLNWSKNEKLNWIKRNSS